MAVPLHPIPPVFVGRTRELGLLHDHLTATLAGRGSLVLIGGEAGIGKSSLIGEAIGNAEQRGAVVLRGHCFEPDRALPYAPMLDLLRTFFASLPAEEVAYHLEQVIPEIVHLLPELELRLPGFMPLPSSSPITDKRRLFHALAMLVARLATMQPVVMVVEDLHWSDDVSLELLLFLARRLSGQPILLLLTYRSDETESSLRHFLAEIDRGRLAIELLPQRLSVAEVGIMLRAILQSERPIRADLVTAIHGLTEGNPFFVEEVLKSLLAVSEAPDAVDAWEPGTVSELRIPRSVQDSVQRRTARLRPVSSHLLALAAIVGRRFDFTLLKQIAEKDERTLLAAIKELIAAQLVVEESVNRFAFRHALTRQAVLAELLARERVALHLAVAETMERVYADMPDPHLSDLAYHHFEAGLWPKALHYGRLAGDAALRLHAPCAAIEHFTRSLRAVYHVTRSQPGTEGQNEPQEETPARLYRERARAYDILGDFERTRADLETALRLARAGNDHQTEWGALLDLGSLWRGRDYTQAGGFLRQAVDIAQTLGDERSRARSLNQLGNLLTNVGQGPEAAAAHEEALALFTSVGDERGTAETLDVLGMGAWLCFGDGPRAVALLDRAVALFRTLGDTHGLISSLFAQAAVSQPLEIAPLFPPLRTSGVHLQMLMEALQLARQVDWPAGQAFTEYGLGRVLIGRGELGRALEHARGAIRLATEIDHQQWLAAANALTGQIFFSMCAPEAAISHLETGVGIARGLGSAWWLGMNSGYLALAYLMQGETLQAEEVLRASPPPEHTPRNLGERWNAWAWAELALARGEPAETLRIAERVLATAHEATRKFPVPAFQRLKGEALLALRRLDDADEALAVAKCGLNGRDVAPFVWPLHRAIARLRLSQKRPAEARLESATASNAILWLAPTIDDSEASERFKRVALATLPVVPTGRMPSSRREVAEQFGGLSAREREVAAEIGLGKSNAEIAATLFIAERTVASHVGHILEKLSFSSRAQIAVWARDQALGRADHDDAPRARDRFSTEG